MRLEVRNDGVAEFCTPYLSVSLRREGEVRVALPRELAPLKGACGHSDAWRYLVPECESFSVEGEALPWATPKEFGFGLGRPYHNVAGIPPRGANKVLLADLFSVERDGGRFYVLRVFSEHGVGSWPRAVFVIPWNWPNELIFTVWVGCGNTRGRAEARVEFKPENDDFVAYFCGGPCEKKFLLGAVTKGLGVDDCAFVQAYVQQACKYCSAPGAVVWWI